MKKRLLSILLTVCMVLSMMPLSVFATDGNLPVGISNIADSGAINLCEHHTGHNEVCGYAPATEEVPCNHEHDEACGLIPAVEAIPATEGIPCDKECTDTDEDSVVDHVAGCAYTPATKEIPVVEGMPCNHKHTDICDYAAASEGEACGFACEICDAQQQPKLIMPLSGSMFSNENTANGQYHLSYRNDGTYKPEVSGTDNSPVLTFKRDTSNGSGGVITSNYTMDFTRSFNIEGSVSGAERDGVSFALHTTKDKQALSPSHNTHMLGANLLQIWPKTTTIFKVTSEQNNITNGLVWDFMTYNLGYYTTMRFHKGAYSYQIVDTTTVNALPDDTSGPLGMKNYSSDTLSGDFKLSWQCTDASSAKGNLTLQMGDEITFTYTNLDAKDVFGGLDKAKAVYFSFSTAMPVMYQNETITETKIAIDKAYYTDTDDGSGKSTLGVETAYYIDTDGNGTYETQLKKATLVGANQTVLCRNKIFNLNKNATSSMDMTLLILNLSKTANSTDAKITSIANEHFYTHETGATGEIKDNNKMSFQGNGPLNSTKPLTDYVKVTLPAGGNGSSAYNDSYAVYEYTFSPGADVTALNQTIQLGVAPFTPAILSSTVFFNSPEAFKPDNTEGKILFGTDGAGGNGLYRVVTKNNTSVTLFYDGASVVTGGKAQSDATAWLNGDFWNSLTTQEQAALMPYNSDGITEKVVLPSEDEVENGGTWGFTEHARATAEGGQAGTDWWLRILGDGSTARVVTQNGTQIVEIATTQENGIRPVMRLNLANVLFTKDSKVNLTEQPSDTLTALSAVGSEAAPFRLTLLDTSRNFVVIEDNENIDVSVGDKISFNYTDATVGANCYVSALLTNNAGQDIYYGRLKAISTNTDANGTAMITIPSVGLGNGTYTLKIFSETIHANQASDVASSLQSITLELGNNLNGTIDVTGTAEYGCTLTAKVKNSNYLGTLKYQWKRNGNEIVGATDSSYTLVADDISTSVTCEVTDSGDSSRDNAISSAAATITKRSLIAKADNKQITTGQPLPSFTVSTSGFVGENTAGDVFVTAPTAAVAKNVDGKTAGTFPIMVTAELKENMETLYQLSTQAGSLVVSTPSIGGSYYTITATAGAGGEISTGKYVSVPEGDSAGFTFTPNKGYLIADVLVNGKSVGAKNSYIFTNVRSNQTIHVTFKAVKGHVNPQTGVAFEDVQEDDWFVDAIYSAVNNGWFAGTSNTTFSPNIGTTRGMIATVLHRMENGPATSAVSIFDDVVSGMYYGSGVHWAQVNSIVSGYGNGKFGPEDNITREQMAAILYRYAQFKGYDVSKTASLDGFIDGGTTSDYAKAPMAWAIANGLISGKGNGILDPKAGATRAQVAAILTRFDELFTK